MQSLLICPIYEDYLHICIHTPMHQNNKHMQYSYSNFTIYVICISIRCNLFLNIKALFIYSISCIFLLVHIVVIIQMSYEGENVAYMSTWHCYHIQSFYLTQSKNICITKQRTMRKWSSCLHLTVCNWMKVIICVFCMCV